MLVAAAVGPLGCVLEGRLSAGSLDTWMFVLFREAIQPLPSLSTAGYKYT